MTIGRSLCRVAIYGGICFGASVLLPELAIPVAFLSTEKGQDILTKVGEMISGVTAGNTANAIDNFDRSRGSDYVRLENEDLIRVCGKAIAQIIHLAAQNSNNPYSKHLKMIAAKATENWVELARSEFAQSKYQELTEGEIPLIITPTEEGLTQAEILTVEEWRTILAKLDLMAVDSAEGVDLPDYVRQYVAELLYKEFPRVLREALKQDFKADGKAFAGLMLQLITGIRQQVAQQGEIALISLAKLEQIEQQLTGTEQQQERISEKIDEQSQKIDYMIELIQPHPSERIENKLRQALLELDYSEQVNLFKEFLDNDGIVGAFLIHGSNKSEPHWLATSLIENVLHVQVETSHRYNTSDAIINLSFVGNTQSRCLNSILRQISEKLRLEVPGYSVDRVVQEICKIWKRNTIIILIEVEENIDSSFLEEFIDKFWQPLAKYAREQRELSSHDYNHSLMLFMLDVDGCTQSWDISFTEDITSEQIPEIPIKLTQIKPMKIGQVRQWLRTHFSKDKILWGLTENLPQEMLIIDQTNIYHKDFIYTICKRLEVDIKWR
ncbi:hypothetical protein AmaxDRAFT_0182 [Limnospira maxima CS-328]|uniref:Inactive STAND domain-containing protein n=1 Tax=Limnospira maxima CS-328 TaxID=513049 RepID=B5VUD8_LIMMA|nr:hypothetical protein [Limnospira maxima]EDZ97154.1 hypothetical protein AmaxDRAFT_0182 [Limnospira maxima CS-328]MDC0838658.1 hypothetical protein [Limnoraphis robusta]